MILGEFLCPLNTSWHVYKALFNGDTTTSLIFLSFTASLAFKVYLKPNSVIPASNNSVLNLIFLHSASPPSWLTALAPP